MQARKLAKNNAVVVLEQPTLTIRDLVNRTNHELKNPIALAVLMTIYANLDADGQFECSDAALAEMIGQSPSTTKLRKKVLAKAKLIAYETHRIQRTRLTVTRYSIPLLAQGGPSENLVGSSETHSRVAKKPKSGRQKPQLGHEQAGVGSSEDQKEHNDSYNNMDNDNDDSIDSTFSEIVGKVLRAGYNNMKDIGKFDKVPVEMVEMWLKQAKTLDNGGGLLYRLYESWEDGGKKAMPKPPPKQAPDFSKYEDDADKPQFCPDCKQRSWMCTCNTEPQEPAANDSPESAAPDVDVSESLDDGIEQPQESAAPTPAPPITMDTPIQDSTPLAGMEHAPVVAWKAAWHQLELQLDSASFDTWYRRVTYLGFEDNTFKLGVRDNHVHDMLQQRLYRNIRRILSDIYGVPIEIVFIAPPTVDPNAPLFKHLEKRA